MWPGVLISGASLWAMACDLDEVEVKNDKGATYQTESESSAAPGS
jgi:hypothetical protein